MIKKKKIVVALDGPAGSGKSTIAKFLAQDLGLDYIDSGALYRSLAYYGLTHFDLVESKEDQIATHFEKNPEDLKIIYENHHQVVIFQGAKLEVEIRTPEVTKQVRYVANHSGCRDIVNQKMRDAAKHYSLVVDGRDIGTVVFPKSNNKFYLDADPVIRATRRAKETDVPLVGPKFDQLVADIIDRDQSDMRRSLAPLKKGKDATVIDTSDLTIDQVVSKIKEKLMGL
ncbi:MAG: (d)CMP kinase [SAR324 cluster bacterium]|nr:(d)CMP kinase [SAR324 cluster bacterium]